MPEDGRLHGYLGVSRSVTGRLWQGPGLELERRAEALVQKTALPDAVARVLARRGVAPEEAQRFLSPTLRDLMPDPARLKDAGRAAERLNNAVAQSEKIVVFADYDVDGGASAALLLDWLAAQGRTATLYVPDRIDEGYGPNGPAIAALSDVHDLIICVDCGTLSHDALSEAEGAADVLVLDHHLGGETLPPALATVNPNRQDEAGDLGHLCAAAVVFLVLVEAGRQQRAAGGTAPDLMQLLDLVALATVADVAPLIDVNRAFVTTGLKVMARRARPGLRALADAAGLNEAPRAHHLGYLLGPRINAGGRIGRADLGARLLAATRDDDAGRLAHELEQLNADRREIEARVTEEALAQAEARGLDGPLVWAAGEGWHPGVVGIVAARLKEATNRPAIVIGMDSGTGKGSGRSVSGVDLGSAVHRIAAEGLISKGGGHAMAAGLTVAADGLASAMDRLSALLARQGAGSMGPRGLDIDGVLMPAAVTPDLIDLLERAGPFGAAAPAPRFVLPAMRVAHAREVGTGHLKLSLAGDDGTRIDAIAFGAIPGPLGDTFTGQCSGRFHVAGRLEINAWQGRRKPQLRLEDAAPADG